MKHSRHWTSEPPVLFRDLDQDKWSSIASKSTRLAQGVRTQYQHKKIHGDNKQTVRRYLNTPVIEPGERVVDWRSVLELLKENTLLRTPSNRFVDHQIDVAEGDVHKLLYTSGHTIWDVADHFECDLSLSPRSEDADAPRALVVRGGEKEVMMAKEALERIILAPPVDGVQESPPIGWYTPGFSSLYQGNDSRSPLRIKPLPQSPVEAISDSTSLPTNWTPNTLRRYIWSLCQKPSARLLESGFERNTMNIYCQRLSASLKQLFANPTAVEHIPPESIDCILNFFIRYGNIDRAILTRNHLQMQGVRFQLQNHHVLMRSAAVSSNLYSFDASLQKLLHTGLRPNADTWNAFLANDLPHAVKKGTIQVMRALNLFRTPQALQGAVVEIVQGDTAKWLDDGRPPLDIIEALDRVYTPDWLAGSTINPILDEWASRGLLPQCLQLIELAFARGASPGVASYRIILDHCAVQKNVDLAIATVRLAERYGARPSVSMYSALSKLAQWRCQYNLARVVWASACIRDAVSISNLRRMVRSLLSIQPPPLSVGHEPGSFRLFRQHFGKIILGIQPPRGVAGRETRRSIQRLICREDLHLPGNAQVHARARALKKALLLRDLKSYRSLTHPFTSEPLVAPSSSASSTSASSSSASSSSSPTFVRRRPVQLWELMRDATAKDKEWLDTGFMQRASSAEKAEKIITPQFHHRVAAPGSRGWLSRSRARGEWGAAFFREGEMPDLLLKEEFKADSSNEGRSWLREGEADEISERDTPPRKGESETEAATHRTPSQISRAGL